MKYSISDLNEKYDLQLDRIINEIKKTKAKLVLLQFPDGLKPWATAVVDFLEEKTSNKVEFLIWIESCYGACDTPVLGKELEKKIDLMIQFGHNSLMPKY
jgi:2-(3-amino-3-carboxypropyl)histidine synthase